MTPEIKVRNSYRVGHRATFSLKQKNDVSFRNMSVESSYKVYHGDDWSGGYSSGGNSFSKGSRIESLRPIPTETGIYEVLLKYEYKLIPTRTRKTWRRNTGASFPWNLLPIREIYTWKEDGDPPAYSCTIDLPVRLNVVPEDQAESVNLVSNPTLDAEMRKRIQSTPTNSQVSFSTPSGRRELTGRVSLVVSSIPVDVAFELFYLPESGERIRLTESSYQAIRIKRGKTGKVPLIAQSELRMEEVGIHKGRLLLTPSVEEAYYDPEIEKIWDGELEFPVVFTVTEKP